MYMHECINTFSLNKKILHEIQKRVFCKLNFNHNIGLVSPRVDDSRPKLDSKKNISGHYCTSSGMNST